MAKPSIQHSHRSGRAFATGSLKLDRDKITQSTMRELSKIGIRIDQGALSAMIDGIGFDANDVGIQPASIGTITTPSIATPIQFLQAWLPGFVHVLTAARKIDDLIGLSTVGAWEDEEVVQGILEPIGGAIPYTDHGNLQLASWNTEFARRTVVRMELGFEVGLLEEARTARMRVNTAAEKRNSVALAMDIQRNRIGFYGYNSGANRTYGFLNDPSLPAYVTVPNGAGGSPLWSSKTYLEIVADLRVALAGLRTSSGDTIDPKKTQITLAVASNRVDFLTTTSEFGNSVLNWLNTNYPNVRIESAPELNDANGGAAVFYLYADSVDDGSTDDKRTFIQVVPAKFMALGVEKRVKTYVEGFSNATAGVMVKRPFAVRRYTGI